uniref:Uncharacterized protein n=1 Tax=Rhizophora mucronata TaxID=61149 RepID=A0A2P2QT07_RHIMU
MKKRASGQEEMQRKSKRVLMMTTVKYNWGAFVKM